MATIPKTVPLPFHSIYPSSVSRKQRKKPNAVDIDLHTKAAPPVTSPESSSSGDRNFPANPETGDIANSTGTDLDVLTGFQTTGAFLTRTASKLLGGQSVTEADSNIHGYAFGRAVKVLNIDGTWYFGTMAGLEGGKIKVHFDGWGSEWDEWLASDSRRLRILDPDEIQQRCAILQAAEDVPLYANSTLLPVTFLASTARQRTMKRSVSRRARDGHLSNKKVQDGPPTQPAINHSASKSVDSDKVMGPPILDMTGTGPRIRGLESTREMDDTGFVGTQRGSSDDKLQIPLQASPQTLDPSLDTVQIANHDPVKQSSAKLANLHERQEIPLNGTQRPLTKTPTSKRPNARRQAQQRSRKLASADLIKTVIYASLPRHDSDGPGAFNTRDQVKPEQRSQNLDSSIGSNANASGVVCSETPIPGPRATNSDNIDRIHSWRDQMALLSEEAFTLGDSSPLHADDDTDVTSAPITQPSSDFSIHHTQQHNGGDNQVPSIRVDIKDKDVHDGDESGEQDTSNAPTFLTLGNPIQLNLPPEQVLQYEHEDEEKEILRIIHRVLDTGLVKNRVVIHPPEDFYADQRMAERRRKKKKKKMQDAGCSQQGQDGAEPMNQKEGSGSDESDDEDDDDDDDNPASRTFKTRDRFVALLEARQESNTSHPSLVSRPPTVKKSAQELEQAREMAMRNMCDIPLLQFVRQIIYNDSDRREALNNPFERRKQKLAGILAERKFAKQRRFGSLSKRIPVHVDSAAMLGITFNEAGYIETTSPLAAKSVPAGQRKPVKKSQSTLQAALDPTTNQDGSQIDANGTFQSLRSLTTTAKRKRVLADDHISVLRRTLVPGARIRARDRQMDWLVAVIRDVKNSRVLVHYEGFQEFFNEWIDINSERLQYDNSLEQASPSQADDALTDPPPVLEANSDDSAIVATEVTHTEPNTIELAEHHQDPAIVELATPEDATSLVQCIQCHVKISQFRIYCMYCEVEAKIEGSGREAFNLCLWCFSNAFPEQHDHPRSSFATKVIVGPRGVRPVKGGIITRFEKDLLDFEFKEVSKPDIEALRETQGYETMGLEGDQSLMYLDQWRDRKVCAFCNDDGISKDQFIGPFPFLLESTNRYGVTKKKHFWAHDTCARHSPEVIQGDDGTWFNVTMAMRRGRTVILYHWSIVALSNHQYRLCSFQKDAYDETFSCDKCSKILGVNPWQTCVKCSDDYFHTFDLCQECFSKDQVYHEHGKQDFKLTSLELIYQEQQEREAANALEQDESSLARKRPVSYKPKMRSLPRLVCSYCWSASSAKWRKGYNGVLMCENCFSAGPVNEGPLQPSSGLDSITEAPILDQLSHAILVPGESNDRAVGNYATSAEDYSHSPYLTRTAVSAVRFDSSSSQAVYLDSYGPAENQLFSLPIDTTYYDIPGRAPRWATHSGTDYHGTWLPQTVRRAVTKFTNPNDKILSNFLGRGTDAIECFLLGRCCTAVDINPAAITLSIRNCSFAIPPDGSIKAEHRPTILQGDSRKLVGPLFESESFDHVLSHPPYKDCVAYSTHIDGDLSRFGNAMEFQREMNSVVRETYRLLKMGRRCTLGIGDNREHCFYIPVSFQLIRQYINEGFELEELIVKRQRYCAMFGLGTYLCVQFDFLCFTHEFIATLRKVPKDQIDTMILEPDFTLLEGVQISSIIRAIPSCPVERKSVVMGSVWTFKPTEEYDFPTLCVSRMVERFGRNNANWEEFKLDFKAEDPEDAQMELWTEHVVETLPLEEEEMVSYERDRLQQIQENNRMLLALGLITDLSESSDDIGHQSKISKDTPRYLPPAETALRMIAHIPGTVLKTHQVSTYRTAIMHLAIEALQKLPVTGVLIVGTQDIRTKSGKLIPLGMLVLEDITRVIGDEYLKLKELVEAVPDGYQKDRRRITCAEEFVAEPRTLNDELPTSHLPIVHACYLVFTKVKDFEITDSTSA
ncbi:hypothetical protein BGZ98_008149 [Dissophora globulifera]|nr:hypothetical protein BGZ98_008149 [Dissophora globulifera]